MCYYITVADENWHERQTRQPQESGGNPWRNKLSPHHFVYNGTLCHNAAVAGRRSVTI